MVITVTAGHITRGQRDNCEFCPIALAISDAAPGCFVRVTGRNVEIEDMPGLGLEMRRFRLPPAAQMFVAYFDNAQPVAPFEFELEIGSEVHS